jgi:glycine cleavage system H protein
MLPRKTRTARTTIRSTQRIPRLTRAKADDLRNGMLTKLRLIHYLCMVQLRFSGAHVWVRVEGQEAVLGLSEYLQDQMGEFTALQLPDLGDMLRAKKRMGHVESEESSSPIEAPISGEVLEVNAEALENPDIITSHPTTKNRLPTPACLFPSLGPADVGGAAGFIPAATLSLTTPRAARRNV